MICTYEEYLKQPKAITFEKMQIIHAEMLAEIGADVEALELYDELMKVSTHYAAIRANWPLLSREEKNEQDSGRTSCHNSVIIHFWQKAILPSNCSDPSQSDSKFLCS